MSWDIVSALIAGGTFGGAIAYIFGWIKGWDTGYRIGRHDGAEYIDGLIQVEEHRAAYR